MKLKGLFQGLLSISLLWGSVMANASTETITLEDGTSFKVLVIEPDNVEETSTAPRLAILVTGWSNNKFLAESQYWLGNQLINRGWTVAAPISADSDNSNGNITNQLLPQLYAELQGTHRLRNEKPILVGISSGGSAALAAALNHPEAFSGVVAAPGRLLDDQPPLQNLKGLPIYLRIGEKDDFRWNRRLETMVNELHRAGARVDAAIVPDARHIFTLDWGELNDWLDNPSRLVPANQASPRPQKRSSSIQ